MKSNRRKHKRFGLKNTLIQFHGEKLLWGRIVDISKNGMKVLSNMKFEEGEIIQVKFNIWNVASLPVNQDYYKLKIKITWVRQTSEKKGFQFCCGASFVEVDDENRKQLNIINDSLNKVKKMSDIEIEKLLSEVRVNLENMEKPK